jgi:CDP-paratose 2-epimerase
VACDNLHRRGSELNPPRLKELGVEFIHADVRQLGDLDRIGEIQALVECSAEPSVMASGDVIVPVNLMGAYHCFEYAARHEAQIVFLSSSRVYPVATIDDLAYAETDTRFELLEEQAVPGASAEGIAEDFPLAGSRTLYGASKLAAELLLAEYEAS